jgi:hypothetical protein
MVLATAFGWSNGVSIAVSIVLAFFFGYGLTIRRVLAAGVAFGAALPIAFASDTLSIAVMELTDNLIIVLVPGALNAGLADAMFWASLLISLAIAFVVAVPVNRWLIARGKGHAVVMELPGHHM